VDPGQARCPAEDFPRILVTHATKFRDTPFTPEAFAPGTPPCDGAEVEIGARQMSSPLVHRRSFPQDTLSRRHSLFAFQRSSEVLSTLGRRGGILTRTYPSVKIRDLLSETCGGA
jgi:hypothetical protein